MLDYWRNYEVTSGVIRLSLLKLLSRVVYNFV